MRILFVSHNFTPESNAPAIRLQEHAREWVQTGHFVEVMTTAPHFPEGKVYDGYTNSISRETVDGIGVLRVPTYITSNSGIVRRTLSFVSFLVSGMAYSRTITEAPDVVVATSPQFFSAWLGYFMAKKYSVPYVLEIRDLWPDSIQAVGVTLPAPVMRFLRALEYRLYRDSDHIVTVTDSFKRVICSKGIPSGKISVIKNGVNVTEYEIPPDSHRLEELRNRLGLERRFVVAYIGTLGMAHRADVLLEAAGLCTDSDIVFLIVGTGAMKSEIEAKHRQFGHQNLIVLDKQPRDVVRELLHLIDLSVVHLRNDPLFETVIPSKIFEAMAAGTPILLGVNGESRRLIEDSQSGVWIPPEDAKAIVDAVVSIKKDSRRREAMATRGREFALKHHDRSVLAATYVQLLEDVVTKTNSAAETT